MNPDRLNRGALLLQKAGSLTDIAAELSVTTRIVSAWRSASKIPNESNQAKLQTAFGIPRCAWHEWSTVAPAAKAAPRARAPEAYWPVPQRCPWLAFGHPLALYTIRRIVLADTATPAADDAIDALEVELEALRERHPGLVSACEAAETALGLALAAETPDDECAAKFLRAHAVSSAPVAA